jgi:hypothetical protein
MRKLDLVTVEITTSAQHGRQFCEVDPSKACEHFVLYVNFPPQGICKICGPLDEPDSLNRFSRHLACKYLCNEEVPDRFWSPLRGG